MKRIAVIPARGGSKRIPRKNIRLFHGNPVIKYSIDSAIESSCFDEVMVSTDDVEIRNIALDCGARVPFLRSTETADDTANLAQVLVEVLAEYGKRDSAFDYACCILPTAPLLLPERIAGAFRLMMERSVSSVFPVVRFSYPVQRGLMLTDGIVRMLNPENYEKRSQDFEPVYHDSGQFYWVKVTDFLVERKFFMKRTAAVELPEMEVQDIDSPEDWKLAEMKYSLLRGAK